MAELFDSFPYLENERIIIRKMEISDVPALSEISNNDHVYKYCPPFLYKKSDKVLETAIPKRRTGVTRRPSPWMYIHIREHECPSNIVVKIFS